MIAPSPPHPVTQNLQPKDISSYCSYHLFCSWSFLNGALAFRDRLSELPWRPPTNPEVVAHANRLVALSESVVCQGRAYTLPELYSLALSESQSSLYQSFISHLDLAHLPKAIAVYLNRWIQLAQNGSPIEVTASFLYGEALTCTGIEGFNLPPTLKAAIAALAQAETWRWRTASWLKQDLLPTLAEQEQAWAIAAEHRRYLNQFWQQVGQHLEPEAA